MDPKELKNHQKQMKEDRFNEKISAGYQSKLLDNAGWDDVSQMKVRHSIVLIVLFRMEFF